MLKEGGEKNMISSGRNDPEPANIIRLMDWDCGLALVQPASIAAHLYSLSMCDMLAFFS